MLMHTSIYQDKTFADYWNQRAGGEGEAYKHLILDPLMFELVGGFAGKDVLELGCGNGYLGPQFVRRGAKRVIMMDFSEHNLRHAAEKCSDPRVSFLQQDATQPWEVADDSLDVVYSNMMLNEVENSKTPIEEAYRVLRSGGALAFSVTHPAWDLYVYAQEKAGVSSGKIIGLGGYFARGYARYQMGGASKNRPELIKKYGGQDFMVEHYHHTVGDYFSQLVGAGFSVKQLLEPELTDELLRHSPKFADYADNPVSLVFYCIK